MSALYEWSVSGACRLQYLATLIRIDLRRLLEVIMAFLAEQLYNIIF